jgi:hypothetical protein
MAEQQNHELAAINGDDSLVEPGDVDLQGLPPVDRGKAAWLTLVACFLLEATTWG